MRVRVAQLFVNKLREVHPKTRERLNTLHTMHSYDTIDLALLKALIDEPRASNAALAERTGLSRNTVHARMKRLTDNGAFLPLDRMVSTVPLGYPLNAWITMRVHQPELQRIADELRAIPEVLQANGLAGPNDLQVYVACRDAHHLFEVDAAILAIEGVERTETTLSVEELIPYRVHPLLEREAQGHAN